MGQHAGKETKQLNGRHIHREMHKEFSRDMLPSIPKTVVLGAGEE